MTTTTSDDFYVTLPSNASTDEFQANAPYHFTVRLPRPLHLPGEGWKVGLSSLSLPDTRANLYRLVPKQQYPFSLKWIVLRNGKRTKRRTTVQMDDINHVYSDIGGSSFVGGQVTDLLREVQYKQQGRGTVYFEPLHIQYLPLRNTFMDQIESQIAETNGQLVRFDGPTPTILTLHFKRDL